jgi:hypothetical protein
VLVPEPSTRFERLSREFDRLGGVSVAAFYECQVVERRHHGGKIVGDGCHVESDLEVVASLFGAAPGRRQHPRRVLGPRSDRGISQPGGALDGLRGALVGLLVGAASSGRKGEVHEDVGCDRVVA